MKVVMLLRHAKTMAAGPGMSDRDRALLPRGHRDARLMGSAIVEQGVPDLILVSPARRTRETLSDVLATVPNSTPVRVVNELYGAQGTYLDLIAANAGDAARVLVIGHNPTIHATALALAGSGNRAFRDELAAKFPTCSLTVSRVAITNWAELPTAAGELVAFIRPRDLGAADAID
ncbi:MAG TPA: histidine phosphatase family protein [Bauldia sp.]|nr:histidine phosphatase family protein [Bauldia sp.]